MELHLPGSMTAPSGPGLSRYEFTIPGGYRGCTVEARNAQEARGMAEGRLGRADLVCTHLSDYHEIGYIDPMFLYGPDAVER